MTELEKKAAEKAQELNGKIEELKSSINEKATAADVQEAIEKAFEGKTLSEIVSSIDAVKELAEEVGLKVNEMASAGQEKNETLLGVIRKNMDGVRKAMKSTVKGEGVVEFNVTEKTLATTAAVTSTRTYRDNDLVPLDKRRMVMSDLWRHVTIGADNAGTISYIDWDTATTARAAAAVAEGAPFPESAVAWEEFNIKMKKIGDSIPVTEEFAYDEMRFAGEIQMFLSDNVDLEVDRQLLLGDGTGANLTGLVTSAPVFTPVNRGITNPTLYDLVPILKETIVKGKGAKYMPNFLMMNLTEINKYKLEKDANNNYIMPPFVSRDGQVIDGLVVVENNLVPDNQLYIGDSRHGRIYDSAEGYSLQLGYVGDQFIEDKKTFKARKRCALLIKESEKPAYLRVSDISAALTALAV